MLERLKEIITQEFTAPDNIKSIFHYTNEQGYSEICRSGHLRINSHLFLNKKDKTNNELQIAKKWIVDQLRNHKLLRSQLTKFFVLSLIRNYFINLQTANVLPCSEV